MSESPLRPLSAYKNMGNEEFIETLDRDFDRAEFDRTLIDLGVEEDDGRQARTRDQARR